ncbi:hypothetical protein [Nonomuraea sp. NPDC049709]|uniref:hypothetical protein n=1 Tax=Nonomuraea sp. NPDC049709 TaxID=3154736 RepID=UPI003427F45F
MISSDIKDCQGQYNFPLEDSHDALAPTGEDDGFHEVAGRQNVPVQDIARCTVLTPPADNRYLLANR